MRTCSFGENRKKTTKLLYNFDGFHSDAVASMCSVKAKMHLDIFDEISTLPAGRYFTLRLRIHVEVKSRPGKARQFST